MNWKDIDNLTNVCRRIPERIPNLLQGEEANFIIFIEALSAICCEIEDFCNTLTNQCQAIGTERISNQVQNCRQSCDLMSKLGVLDSMLHELDECMKRYYRTALCILSEFPSVNPIDIFVDTRQEYEEETEMKGQCIVHGVAQSILDSLDRIYDLVMSPTNDLASDAVKWCKMGNHLHQLLRFLFEIWCFSGFEYKKG